ncbi:MAG: ABC transporter ATP-binding protein, partial [Phototrophicaceae bacterium]
KSSLFMTTMIRIDNLSKQYRIGAKEDRPRTIVESVMRMVKSPFNNLRRLNKLIEIEEDAQDAIWALRDVSFDIGEGEVVGIIGRNGAGKSTLLKILSRITPPTIGQVTLYGRVGSLLEVGTGFHPELTGRENVYLNGTILGMTKAEIDRKFDEIVDFSGVERFIDTPIKRYSSGMQVRLAFAVAAHLEPEILIVDEVLSVGDAEFQKKSIGKMQDVSKSGRTVLFVSHNMNAIRNLCSRAIWMENGMLKSDGEVNAIATDYMRHVLMTNTHEDRGITIQVETLDEYGKQINPWNIEQEMIIRIAIQTKKPLNSPAVDVAAYSLNNDARLFSLQSDMYSDGIINDYRRDAIFEFRVTNVGLSTQQIYLDVGVKSSGGSYEALFKQVEIISVSSSIKAPTSRNEAILHLPSSISVYTNDSEKG